MYIFLIRSHLLRVKLFLSRAVERGAVGNPSNPIAVAVRTWNGHTMYLGHLQHHFNQLILQFPLGFLVSLVGLDGNPSLFFSVHKQVKDSGPLGKQLLLVRHTCWAISSSLHDTVDGQNPFRITQPWLKPVLVGV